LATPTTRLFPTFLNANQHLSCAKKKQKPVGSANTFSLTPPTKLPSKKTGNPALPLPLAAHKSKTDLSVDPKETFICATIYRYMFLGFQQQKEIHLRKKDTP